jgi:hypothetical protein
MKVVGVFVRFSCAFIGWSAFSNILLLKHLYFLWLAPLHYHLKKPLYSLMIVPNSNILKDNLSASLELAIGCADLKLVMVYRNLWCAKYTHLKRAFQACFLLPYHRAFVLY